MHQLRLYLSLDNYPIFEDHSLSVTLYQLVREFNYVFVCFCFIYWSSNHFPHILFRFAHPIYIDGDYPPIMRYQINRKNIERNISVPRLPYFTEEEKMLVKGTWCICVESSSSLHYFNLVYISVFLDQIFLVWTMWSIASIQQTVMHYVGRTDLNNFT